MDPFTHSFVGLAGAKAGLERLSPLATTVCVLAANSPDCDVIVGLTTDRWTYLHHHRGITHSIVGVIGLAFIVPLLVWALERGWAKWRRRPSRASFRGLLLASVIMTATHPLMDWTNNYGVRPFLPWSSRWYYGDLLFIVDPYLWLILGGAAFLATKNGRLKMVLWGLLAALFVTVSFVVDAGRDPSVKGIAAVRVILLVGIVSLVLARMFGFVVSRERGVAVGAFVLVVIYLIGLRVEHGFALREAQVVADQVAAQHNEYFRRLVAMPMLATPTRWFCVAETDQAIYRFPISIGMPPPEQVVNGYQADASEVIERYEKPTGKAAQLAAVASQDRRARILLDFARFPIAEPRDENCLSQTIVQFADLRYTRPGAGRGTFSLDVPVECPPR